MKLIDTWILLLGVAALLTVPPAAVAQQPCEELEGFHKMDFWVGAWSVRVGDRQVGTNRITKILDGCAVREEWTGGGGGEGQSLFYYVPSSDEWKQVWVTSNATRIGGVKEKTLVETMEDGSLRFQGRIPDSEGALWYDRTTLTPLDGGQVRQLIQISEDGEAWETTFDAVYVPLEEAGEPSGATTGFRGDVQRSGSFPGDHGPELRGMAWRFPTRGMVVASPVVWGGRVFVGSGDGSFHALDLERGRPAWSVEVGAAVASSAAVGAGRVHFVDRAGVLHTLSADNGEPAWTLDLGPAVPFPWGHESGDHFTSSPLLFGDTLVVAGIDGVVRALEAPTGRELWLRDLGARILSSPTAGGPRPANAGSDRDPDPRASGERLLFVADVEGRIHALSGAGEVRWRYETVGAGLDSDDFGFDRRTVQSTPAVVDGRLFVGSRDGKLYALDATTGRELWRSDHGTSWVITSPAVADGMVYAGSSDAAFVQALDAQTGRELWRVPDLDLIWSSPVVAGETVYVATWGGSLHALGRTDGEARWSFPVDGMILSSPVVAGDRVIFGAADGGVYALRTGREPVARHVFYDPSLDRASRVPRSARLADQLATFGYERLDGSTLPTRLRALATDGVSSVVVFASDHLPVEVDPAVPELLRAYLDGGGKVVWPGGPGPVLWPRDPETGSPGRYGDIAWERTTELLDVDHGRSIFDFRGARATAEGERWGLEGWWRQGWGVSPKAVTRVLALDDWGLAASWVKEYGGGPGTGFVLVPSEIGFDVVFRTAEFRPEAR